MSLSIYVCVPMDRAQSGLPGVLGTSKMKENKRFYGFTEFRGKLAGRGREGRGPTNQITAGYGIPISRVAFWPR